MSPVSTPPQIQQNPNMSREPDQAQQRKGSPGGRVHKASIKTKAERASPPKIMICKSRAAHPRDRGEQTVEKVQNKQVATLAGAFE